MFGARVPWQVQLILTVGQIFAYFGQEFMQLFYWPLQTSRKDCETQTFNPYAQSGLLHPSGLS
jgi:hypothetical protein